LKHRPQEFDLAWFTQLLSQFLYRSGAAQQLLYPSHYVCWVLRQRHDVGFDLSELDYRLAANTRCRNYGAHNT